MAYNFRSRTFLNSRGTYLGSSGSDEESYNSDPDFRTPARPPRRSVPRASGIRLPGSEGENSSGNMERKRSSRRSRSSADGEEHRRGLIERHRRRKRTKFSQVSDLPITKRTVLSWLISLGIVLENEVVWYVDSLSGNILGEGKVDREGILCSCCSVLVTVGEFEVHAGRKTKKPYQHIVLAGSQLSLLDCQIEAWEDKQEEEKRKFNNIKPAPKATDKNDDACMICADGGDLVCCEKCPSTFHPKCIFMESIPQGDWLCFYCVCKYCGTANGILKKCAQCEKLYHGRCGGERLDLMNPPAALFCGKSCRKIYEGLQSFLGVRNDLRDGLSWTLIQRRDQPLSGSDEYTRVMSNSKIRVHGKMLAEMPFIGTRGKYRRQGMARVLENCVESALCALKVEKLVIPSMNHLTSMWIDRYFFSRVEDESLKQALSVYNTVMFPAKVVKLHKTLAMLPDLNKAPPEPNDDF
ncbi:ATP-dependent caseinolytic protease/crotonase family protein [Hibiscus syriacus]|uniref:ATP-dependent caseinolytic protease/crotonase family protein n=1 Tax=Hibiscus syriacus TaxID=106335 RepID=A0A6A2XT02_HIBSY|nr:increased DNA methylation 1-like [Hibiscus syriacus]KAE8678628.1 ATP-dependent caseinolytic protease/crotonase family protein [Hibiscus syriacus]